MNKTEKKILKLIYSQGRYWWVHDISERVGVSDVTTRKYIKSLRKNGYIIVSKSLGTYKVQSFKTLLKTIKLNPPLFRSPYTVEQCEKRISEVRNIIK